jgi:hypothetical protein
VKIVFAPAAGAMVTMTRTVTLIKK